MPSNSAGGDEEVVCDACGFEASFVPEGMIACERCRAANYCSVTCLQWHWKSGGHSRTCVPIVLEEEESEEQESSKSSVQTAEQSLISMDVNHIFDSTTVHSLLTTKATSSAVSVDESVSSGTTTPASNIASSSWGEKIKGVPPSATIAAGSATPESSPSTDSASDLSKSGSKLKLGAYFEQQKKQSSPRSPKKPPVAILPGANQPSLLVAPVDIEEEEVEEEVIIEEYEEEEEEVMSLDLLNEDSGHDNLKSIVEESEVTGDDPDYEGSWRSRDPFARNSTGAWVSPQASPSAGSSSANKNCSKNSPLFQQSPLKHDDEIMGAVIEDVYEEVTEVEVTEVEATEGEEVVDDETETLMEAEVTDGEYSGGQAYHHFHRSDSKSNDVGITSVVASPGRTLYMTAGKSTSPMSPSSSKKQRSLIRAGTGLSSPALDQLPIHRAVVASEPRSSVGAVDSSNGEDDLSRTSDGVEALMNQYGYDSAMDDDSYGGGGSSGSLNAETGGDTTRTEDTARLASVPAVVAQATSKLINDVGSDEETSDGEQHNDLSMQVHPPLYLRQKRLLGEIDSLISSISRDPDSSMGTITTEERSSSAAGAVATPSGQDSKEGHRTGSSTGQHPKEDSDATSLLKCAAPKREYTVSLAECQKVDDVSASPASSPALVRSLSDSSQMSIAAAENQHKSTSSFPVAVAERRHSGPIKDAAASLLDFRNVYGSSRQTTETGNASSLKAFRLAYGSTLPTPKTPSSVTSTLTVPSVVPGSVAPPSSVRPSPPHTSESKPAPTSPSQDASGKSQSSKPLTVSINKALIDFEKVYGKEAAAAAYLRLAQHAESAPKEALDSTVTALPKMFTDEGVIPVVATEPTFVSVMANGEDVQSEVTSSVGPRPSAPHTFGASVSSGTLTRTLAPSEASPVGSVSRPRYLAYRNILSRSIATPKTTETKRTETETGTEMLEDSTSGRDVDDDEQEDIPMAPVEARSSSAPLFPASPALQPIDKESSSVQEAEKDAVKTASSPYSQSRYQSYRTSLGRSLLSAPGRSERSDGVEDVRHVIPVAVTSTAVQTGTNSCRSVDDGEELKTLVEHGSSTSLPFDEDGAMVVGYDPDQNKPRYTSGSMNSSLTAVDAAQPRYLSYRQSVARRVPQSPAPNLVRDGVEDSAVEERLSTYLRRGMTGAEARLGSNSAADTKEENGGAPTSSGNESSSTQGGYKPQPLKSRRAASALARAKEAQQGRDGGILVSDGSKWVDDFERSAPSALEVQKLPVRDLEAGGEIEDAERDRAIDPQPDPDRPSRKRQPPRRILIILIIVAVIAIVVGVTVGVTSTVGAKAAASPTNSTAIPGAGDVKETDVPGVPPTSPPTRAPPGQATEASALRALLSAVSLDDGASLSLEGSPQNQAYTWLSRSADLDTYSDDRKVQRYALATLYFSTQGESWQNRDGWLSDESECRWFSRSDIVCDDVNAYTRLTLGSNNLRGSVPPEVSLLLKLTTLSFNGNSLTSLPASVGTLTSLEVLAANDNDLEGALATEFGALSALQRLYLHGNRLSGNIPSQIGRLESLETLDFSTNRLEGSIPTELGLLVNLQRLFLQSNQLTGPVPTQLASMSGLTEVRIDDNDLTGSVPTEVCDTFSGTLPTFYLDCGGASPKVTCPPGTCCTHCCSNNDGTAESICQCLFEGSGFDFLCE